MPARLTALLLVTIFALVAAPSSAAPTAGSIDAKAAAKAKKKPRYTEAQKRKIRRQLSRQLRKNPRLIRRRWFVRKASHVGYELPLTVRMNPIVTTTGASGITHMEASSNDSLQFDLGTTVAADPAGVLAGVTSTTVTGRFNLRAKFGGETVGYGTLGVMELGVGDVSLAGTSIPVVNADPACGDGNPLLKTGPLEISEAPPLPAADRRGGHLNWFTGDISVRLYTQVNSNSLRRDSDSCLAGYSWTDRITSTSNPIVPIDMVGRFSVSPAITSDGRLRLFKLAFQDAVTPQAELAARLRFCRVPVSPLEPEANPAPTGTCAPGLAPTGDELEAFSYVKVKDFTAEVLIGGG